MSSVSTMEAFDRLIPMVSLIGGLNIVLGVLSLTISIAALVIVIRLYKRK